MTEQEYKNKQKMLKQVRTKISDLKQQEQNLSRDIAKYEYDKNIKGNRYYNEDFNMWVQPVQLRGEVVVSRIFDNDFDPNAYIYMKHLCVEEGIFDMNDFDKMKKVSKKEFDENVSRIMNEFYELLSGGEKK